ncbi:TPA: DUF4400 domain-containing protein [Vibrio vulnificus]|nr:DUF4400 domain-containing protein [Vibrio vulnificus]
MARVNEEMANNRKASRPTPKSAEEVAESQRGVITGLFAGLTNFIGTLITSMFCSVIVSIVGVTFIWPEKGAEHERASLRIEMEALADELANAGSYVVGTVEKIVVTLLDAWWLGELWGEIVRFVTGFVWAEKAAMYAEVAFLAVQIFVVRLGVILSSLPVIGLWVLVAIVCGLAERDLRRINIAKESSTIFNLYIQHMKVPFTITLVFYLSWPTHAYALFGTLPICIGTAIVVYGAVANYKKRL